jgi:hypothetical protein
MDVRDDGLSGTDIREKFENSHIACLASGVLTEEHGHAGVEGNLLACCQSINSVALPQTGEAQHLCGVAVRPIVSQQRDLGSLPS